MISSLTPIERRIARARLFIDPATVEGRKCRAMIVGEAPGPRTSAHCPMFPYPEHSSGARLRKISGFTNAEYLARFVRRDLLSYCPAGPWRAADRAKAKAAAELLRPEVEGLTLVMLGRSVARAFGLEDQAIFTALEHHDPTWGRATFVRLPHPSGRVTAYSDPAARAAARKLLRTAAALEMPPCPECKATVLATDPPEPLERYTCPCGANLSLSYDLSGEMTATLLNRHD